MKSKVLELLQKYNVKLEETGDKYRANCPIPGHLDENPSFIVYPLTDSWYCFSEAKGGGPVQLLMALEQISREEAQKRLGTNDPVQEVERLLKPEVREEADFNVETNFIISGLIREKLLNGYSWEQVAPRAKEFDKVLATQKLNEQQAKQFIQQFSSI